MAVDGKVASINNRVSELQDNMVIFNNKIQEMDDKISSVQGNLEKILSILSK